MRPCVVVWPCPPQSECAPQRHAHHSATMRPRLPPIAPLGPTRLRAQTADAAAEREASISVTDAQSPLIRGAVGGPRRRLTEAAQTAARPAAHTAEPEPRGADPAPPSPLGPEAPHLPPDTAPRRATAGASQADVATLIGTPRPGLMHLRLLDVVAKARERFNGNGAAFLDRSRCGRGCASGSVLIHAARCSHWKRTGQQAGAFDSSRAGPLALVVSGPAPRCTWMEAQPPDPIPPLNPTNPPQQGRHPKGGVRQGPAGAVQGARGVLCGRRHQLGGPRPGLQVGPALAPTPRARLLRSLPHAPWHRWPRQRAAAGPMRCVGASSAKRSTACRRPRRRAPSERGRTPCALF